MLLYILKRLLLFIPTLLGITLITFILMQSLPGDPVAGMAGERATRKRLPASARNWARTGRCPSSISAI